MKTIFSSLALIAALFAGSVFSFAPNKAAFTNQNVNSLGKLQGHAYIANQQQSQHAVLQKQRRSMAPVQTMSLFGLGGVEIAIILVAAAFVLGPQKLAEFSKDAGKMASEMKDLKKVPEEFRKGLEEGEMEARSRNAKEMDSSPE